MDQLVTKPAARVKELRQQPLHTPNDVGAAGVADVAAALNLLLADVYALFFKTKNFHWHMSGPHFHGYHLLLEAQAKQIQAMGDPLAERVRKIGAMTLRSIGEIARLQRIPDNDADYVEPSDMLAELRDDNQVLATRLREVHALCDGNRDWASTSLIDSWIDQTERRVWFLFECGRRPDSGGR